MEFNFGEGLRLFIGALRNGKLVVARLTLPTFAGFSVVGGCALAGFLACGFVLLPAEEFKS